MDGFKITKGVNFNTKINNLMELNPKYEDDLLKLKRGFKKVVGTHIYRTRKLLNKECLNVTIIINRLNSIIELLKKNLNSINSFKTTFSEISQENNVHNDIKFNCFLPKQISEYLNEYMETLTIVCKKEIGLYERIKIEFEEVIIFIKEYKKTSKTYFDKCYMFVSNIIAESLFNIKSIKALNRDIASLIKKKEKIDGKIQKKSSFSLKATSEIENVDNIIEAKEKHLFYIKNNLLHLKESIYISINCYEKNIIKLVIKGFEKICDKILKKVSFIISEDLELSFTGIQDHATEIVQEIYKINETQEVLETFRKLVKTEYLKFVTDANSLDLAEIKDLGESSELFKNSIIFSSKKRFQKIEKQLLKYDKNILKEVSILNKKNIDINESFQSKNGPLDASSFDTFLNTVQISIVDKHPGKLVNLMKNYSCKILLNFHTSLLLNSTKTILNKSEFKSIFDQQIDTYKEFFPLGKSKLNEMNFSVLVIKDTIPNNPLKEKFKNNESIIDLLFNQKMEDIRNFKVIIERAFSCYTCISETKRFKRDTSRLKKSMVMIELESLNKIQFYNVSFALSLSSLYDELSFIQEEIKKNIEKISVSRIQKIYKILKKTKPYVSNTLKEIHSYISYLIEIMYEKFEIDINTQVDVQSASSEKKKHNILLKSIKSYELIELLKKKDLKRFVSEKNLEILFKHNLICFD